jgi:hypothetical protein
VGAALLEVVQHCALQGNAGLTESGAFSRFGIYAIEASVAASAVNETVVFSCDPRGYRLVGAFRVCESMHDKSDSHQHAPHTISSMEVT